MQKKESPQGLSFFASRICAAAPCRAGPVCPAGTNAVFCGGTHGSRPTDRCGKPSVGDGVPTSRQRGSAALQGPLDKPTGMGIIINTRGRCIRRSVPVSLKLYLDLNDPQKPSPCPVAVFAFQSLDSYRDRMTQNMNRKHEKHTVPPPFEEVTNRLTMYAASLRRVYTAGGFLSNSGGRTWASPLRGDGFPRQCEHWLGMTARRCRADGTSYPKGVCSAALHGRTPSPTKSQRGRCKKGGQVSALYIPYYYI